MKAEYSQLCNTVFNTIRSAGTALAVGEATLALLAPAAAQADQTVAHQPAPFLSSAKTVEQQGAGWKETGRVHPTGPRLLGLSQKLGKVANISYGETETTGVQGITATYDDTITNTGRLPIAVSVRIQPDDGMYLDSVSVPSTWFQPAGSRRHDTPASIHTYRAGFYGRERSLGSKTMQPLVAGESITIEVDGTMSEQLAGPGPDITQINDLGINVTGKPLPIRNFSGHAFSDASEMTHITYTVPSPAQ